MSPVWWLSFVRVVFSKWDLTADLISLCKAIDQLGRDGWWKWSSYLIILPIPPLSVTFGAARYKKGFEKMILRMKGTREIE